MSPHPLELYLLRHADAGDPAAWEGDDDARPLSKKGHRQVERLARWLRALGWVPDAIVSSPRVRAVETAEQLADVLGARAIVRDERLAGPLAPEVVSAIVAELDPAVARVVLVGHDPDFSELASMLTDGTIQIPKGALVRIDLPVRIASPASGVLRWFLPPDAVPKR